MCGCGSNDGWAPFFPTFGAGRSLGQKGELERALCRGKQGTKHKSEWKPGFQVFDYYGLSRNVSEHWSKCIVLIHWKSIIGPRKKLEQKSKGILTVEERPGNGSWNSLLDLYSHVRIRLFLNETF